MAAACLFLVVPGPGFSEAELHGHLGALTRYLGPLDPSVPVLRPLESGAVLGSIGLPSPLALAGETAWWLERPPPELRSAADFVAGSDADLRRMHCGALAAADGGRGRVAVGPCGPTSLYVAESSFASVCSTHAVAAALLSGGGVTIDSSRLPHLMALGFIGGDGSLVEGVRPVPPGTVVEGGEGGFTVRSYWSDRWALVEPERAEAAAREELLRSLDRRLAVESAPFLGLTAGLDSRVVATAAAELGVELPTFTWTHAPGDDAGAAEAAARLGLPHERLEPIWLDEDSGLEEIDREVRWNEGIGQTNAFARVQWPEPMSAFVTGGAGETGRAFWWRELGRSYAEPTLDRLEKLFRPDKSLLHAPAEVAGQVRGEVRGLLAGAAASGVRGWAILDVLYADQRVARWGRGMLARRPTIPAFADQSLLAALVSLPVEDRLRGGFHSGLLAAHGLAGGSEPGGQRRGVPRPVRRLRSAMRARANSNQDARWVWADAVGARPAYRVWLRDAVLPHALVEAAFGSDWVRQAQLAFDGELQWAGEAAIALSGPVALHAAVHVNRICNKSVQTAGQRRSA